MQFSLRSLLILMTVAAVFTIPTYRYSASVYERWNASKPVAGQFPTLATVTTNTVVNAPDGGTILIGGIAIRPDGSRYVNGKLV